MTDKEKLEKIKELADAMYYAAQHLTTDASRLHEAMDGYHKFIINKYHKEEPVSEDLDIAIGEYCSNPDNFITYIDVAFAYRSEQKDDIPLIIKAIKFGANWQKEQMMAKAVDFTKEHNTACVLASECLRNHGWFSRERVFNDLFRHLSCVDKLFEGKFCGKTKVIVIKED